VNYGVSVSIVEPPDSEESYHNRAVGSAAAVVHREGIILYVGDRNTKVYIPRHLSKAVFIPSSDHTNHHSSRIPRNLPLPPNKMNATPRLLGKVLKAIGPKEPHPYFIYPTAAAAYPINPAFLGQRLGRTAGM